MHYDHIIQNFWTFKGFTIITKSLRIKSVPECNSFRKESPNSVRIWWMNLTECSFSKTDNYWASWTARGLGEIKHLWNSSSLGNLPTITSQKTTFLPNSHTPESRNCCFTTLFGFLHQLGWCYHNDKPLFNEINYSKVVSSFMINYRLLALLFSPVTEYHEWLQIFLTLENFLSSAS